MKTGLEMVDDVYSLINKPEVKALINGMIAKHRRPKASKRKDIVVGSLALSAFQLQQGITNVNIHIPNLKGWDTLDGIADDQQPDSATFKAITSVIVPLLDAQYKETFHTAVMDAPNLGQDSDGTWYMNIRVNYYAVINNFKNL